MDRRTLELVKAEFRKKRVAPLGKGRGKQKDAQVFLFSQVKTQLVEAAREMNVEVSLINRVSQVSAHIFELRVHVRTHTHTHMRHACLVLMILYVAQLDIALVYCAAWSTLKEMGLLSVNYTEIKRVATRYCNVVNCRS
jgi:hypothetical protein